MALVQDREIVKWNQIEQKWTDIYVASCFFQWCQDNSMREKIIFSTYDLEKLDIRVKNNIDSYLRIIQKN